MPDTASHWSVSCSADDRSSESSINSGSPALSAAARIQFLELPVFQSSTTGDCASTVRTASHLPSSTKPLSGWSASRTFSASVLVEASAGVGASRGTTAASDPRCSVCRRDSTIDVVSRSTAANVRMASLAITAVWMQNCTNQGCTIQQDDRRDSCAPGAAVKPVLLSDQGLELTSVLQAASRIALDRRFTWPVVVVGAPVVFLQNKHFYVHVREPRSQAP